MRHVRQTNRSSGCGPACIAIIANVEEREAQLAMFPDGRTQNFWSTWRQVKLALDKLGVPYAGRPKRVAKWETIPTTAIVGCGRLANGNWHWVVFDPKSELVYDPQKAEPLPFCRFRRKPFSYLSLSNPT